MSPFDVTQVSELAEAAKKELRKRMRSVRTAHPSEALAARSARIVERASELPEFQRASSIALFYPMEDRKEVDLRELDRAARAASKRVYYPFLEQRGEAWVSGLRSTSSLSEVRPRGGRFSEPDPSGETAARADVDLVFVPALAVAPSGHRLGYGAGFYDSLLPDVCPPGRAIAVVFDFQLLVELPTLPHDVPCDLVITDARTLRCR